MRGGPALGTGFGLRHGAGQGRGAEVRDGGESRSQDQESRRLGRSWGGD